MAVKRIGIKELELSLERVQEWVKNADQKISIFLAFVGVLLALCAPLFVSWFLKNVMIFSSLVLFLSLISIYFISLAVMKIIIALIPKTKKQNYNKSMLFFGDISSHSYSDFAKAMPTMSLSNYRTDLVDQIYISSQIATKKHVYFRDSVVYFFVGIICLIITYLIFWMETLYG